MVTTDTVHHLAAKTAALLADWANLNPARKHDNGDTSERGLLTMMLGVLADRSGPPPADAEKRIYDYLVTLFKSKMQEARKYGEAADFYVSFDVDYGPGRALSDLSTSCGLNVSWPNKSHMTVRASNYDAGSISNAQGYRSEPVNYQLVPELGGMLVTRGFTVDSKIRNIVAKAVIAGDPVATWEPISPPAVTVESESESESDGMTQTKVNDLGVYPALDEAWRRAQRDAYTPREQPTVLKRESSAVLNGDRTNIGPHPGYDFCGNPVNIIGGNNA